MTRVGWTLAVALGLFAARPARADVRVLAPAAGSIVRAGAVIEIRWTDVPDSSRELELLLSLDDGGRFPVRLTGELHPGTRSFTWQVPNLPAAHARILVRFDDDGREEEGEAGPPFTILADPGQSAEIVRFHRGELWLGSGPASGEVSGPAFGDGRESRVLPLAPFTDALASSRKETAAPPAATRALAHSTPSDFPVVMNPDRSGLGFLQAIPQRR